MVILLESTQNIAMRLADPYSSPSTIWYHVIWSTQGVRLGSGGVRHGAPIHHHAQRERSKARPFRLKRPRGPLAGTYCDPAQRDQPAVGNALPEHVAIPPQIRSALACAICDVCARRKLAIRCLNIGDNHVHALMKLDANEALARATIEDCKRISCLLACTDRSEGFWSRGCELLAVRSELHFDRIAQLICNDREQGSYLWKHPRLMRAEEEKQPQRASA